MVFYRSAFTAIPAQAVIRWRVVAEILAAAFAGTSG
jgi:hypothetical protein